MFNRLAAVRLKAAEDALAAGRLSDAFEIAISSDLSGQRRTRQVLEAIGRALLECGQEKLLNRQFAEALADFDKAARCGLPPDAVGEWQRRAKGALIDDRRAQNLKDAALIEARQRLAAGSLAGAEQALAKSPIKDVEGAAVSREIEIQRQRAAELLESARKAYDDNQVLSAVRHLTAARSSDARLEGIARHSRLPGMQDVRFANARSARLEMFEL